jgi:CheY-like chemotaxis protein
MTSCRVMITRAIPRTGPRRCKLLYVEEHAENVTLLQALLAERKDLLLLHAVDANLGIKQARSARPEVILIDADLAGMSALEFLKVLRADPALQATPILALGTDPAPKAVVRALEAGFFQLLAKPLRVKPLMEALDFALEFVAVERSEQNTVPLHRRTTTLVSKESR